ncbi:MAG: hypothetical protein NZL83_03205 [Candidatus Absconditabacterales bacterium]|nr:hypothetical protein [Candidatus Absconditabacterales bacterium]
MNISPHEQPAPPTLLFAMRIELAKILQILLGEQRGGPNAFILSRDRAGFSGEKGDGDVFYNQKLLTQKQKRLPLGTTYQGVASCYNGLVQKIFPVIGGGVDSRRIGDSAEYAKNESNWASFWKKYHEHFFSITTDLSDTFNNNLLYSVQDRTKYVSMLIEVQKIIDWYDEKEKSHDERVKITSFYDNEQQKLFFIRGKIEHGTLTLIQGEGENCKKITTKDLEQYIANDQTSGPTALPKYLLSIFYNHFRIDDGKDLPFTYALKTYFLALTQKVTGTSIPYPIVAFPEGVIKQTKNHYPCVQYDPFVTKIIANFVGNT